jgi:hypothetical protein
MKLDPLPIHPDTVEAARAAANCIATHPLAARDALILSLREKIRSDLPGAMQAHRGRGVGNVSSKFPEVTEFPERVFEASWAAALDLLADQFMELVADFVPRMGDQQLTNTRH